MDVKNPRKKNMPRGENFVEEPTGSAPMINLDGRQESDREGKPVAREDKPGRCKRR